MSANFSGNASRRFRRNSGFYFSTMQLPNSLALRSAMFLKLPTSISYFLLLVKFFCGNVLQSSLREHSFSWFSWPMCGPMCVDGGIDQCSQ